MHPRGVLGRLGRLGTDAHARLGLRIVLAGVQTAFIAWFSPGRGLPLDDAWIHQVVARTFAETGTLGYAPGHHGAAATSYLWAALLGIDFKLLHLDFGRWALILNTLAALASGQLLFAMLLRARGSGVGSEATSAKSALLSPSRAETAESDVGPREWMAVCWIATAFACCSPNILWFVCSGMEAMPFIALSLCAIWAATSPSSSTQRAILGGIAAGGLAFLRPEAAPLGGLLAAHALLRMRDARRATSIGVPWLLAVALYVVSNIAKTGHLLPSTLAGRTWLWFEMSTGLSRSDRTFDFLDQWGTRLGTYTFDTSLAVVWVLVAIAAYGAFRLCRRRVDANNDANNDDGLKVLFGWALFHAAFYALLLPTSGHGGRYQPLTPLLFACCVPLGSAFLLREVVRLLTAREARFAWFAAIGIAPWIVLTLPVGKSLRTANALAVAHIQATELDTGTFVSSLPEGAIASFDIGGIGYTAKRRVLDLGGLSDPSTAALLETGRLWTWLESNKVRFIVLPASYERVLPVFEDYAVRLHLRDNPAIRLEPIRVFETPFDKWEPAIKATWNAAPKQIVYEVQYTSKEGPREGPALLPADTYREVADPAGLVPRRERIVAEHMLATVAAWGMPIDVRLTLPSDVTNPPVGSSASSSSSLGNATTGAALAPTFDLASGGIVGDAPPPKASSTTSPCIVRLGAWGIGFDESCAAIADVRILRAMAYENVGRYLDLGDLGGALRAVVHVLVQAKRLRDPRFHPSIAPLNPPVPGGVELPAMRAGAWGLVLFLLALLFANGIEIAARRDLRLPRLVRFVQTKVTRTPSSSIASLTLLTFLMFASALLIPGCSASDTDVTRAVGRGRGAVEIALANGGDVNEVPGSNRVPILDAVTLGDADVVALLLERGARLDVVSFDGASPLHIAARHGHHTVVALLVNAMTAEVRKAAATTAGAGAGMGTGTGQPQERDAIKARLSSGAGPRSRTALHDAVGNGSPESVATLLAAGADANKADSFGQTPLHLACVIDPSRSTAIVLMLLGAGADPQTTDARGFNVFHAAAAADNAPLLRILLNGRTARMDEPTVVGETALDIALRYERDRAADMLFSAGSRLTRQDAWPPLHDAARTDSVVRIANLIANGTDLDRVVRGKTALDLARENDSKRALLLLDGVPAGLDRDRDRDRNRDRNRPDRGAPR